MPSPSPASTASRTARYRRDCANFTEPGVGGPRYDRSALEQWCAGRPWREHELARLRAESAKLDEVLEYIGGRLEDESLGEWRARRRGVNHAR